jgi:hypothetical protein
MRALDDFLPAYEYSERHSIEIGAGPDRIDAALRAVTLADSPLTFSLFRLRGLRRQAREPFLAGMKRMGAVLEDAPGEGIVLGLTGQFWRLGGGHDDARARTAAEFLAFDRADACKAVLDFRANGSTLSTETRVHVRDPRSRRRFARYWLVVRPFSGLTRILLLRAVKRRAEA